MSAFNHPLDLHEILPERRLLGLWRLMRGFRLTYLLATLTLAIASISKTATYLLLRYFADSVLDKNLLASSGMSEITRMLLLIALGFIGLAAVEGGFTYFSGRLAARTAESIAQRLRNYLFDHLQRLSFTYHSQTKTGDLVERVTSDVDALRRFFADQAIGVGRIVLLFVINFTALLNLDVGLALASVIVVPFIVITSVFFFKRVTKAYEAYQEQEAILTTTLQENLTGVRVVKAFARQDYERNKFERDNWEKYRRARKLNMMHSLFWPLSDLLCGAQMLGGFFLAGWLAIDGRISVGTYMAYVGLIVWLIWPMRNLGRLIVNTSTGLVSYGRVREVIRQEQEPLYDPTFQPPAEVRGQITFREVCFAYEEDESATLENITFDCQPGQVIALLGSTGSGKTTLVNLLPRFYDYTGGSITLDGRELRDYPRAFLRSQIGIVEQEPFLFSRSIGENIRYGVGREVPQAEVEAAAQAAAIHDMILTFPEGYETLVGERGVTLSGGQKQRVAIARTLLKNPRILILDDSTSSVDTETEAVIRQALEALMKDRTTFIIAHRIQSVMDADLILVMDKGRVVQMGKHADLLPQPGMYRQIYDIQTRIEAELEHEIRSAA